MKKEPMFPEDLTNEEWKLEEIAKEKRAQELSEYFYYREGRRLGIRSYDAEIERRMNE